MFIYFYEASNVDATYDISDCLFEGRLDQYDCEYHHYEVNEKGFVS